MAKPFALKSKRVVAAKGPEPLAVLVRDERIEAVAAYSAVPSGYAVVDVGDRVVMPAFVDTHVHVNEPGRTEWEGFKTATQAAAAGGVGTIVDMPLNSIPVTTSLQALETKLRAARGKLWVDCGFWGGVVPSNSSELEPMIDAGVAGFKAFLIDSGIEEFPPITKHQLQVPMRVLALRGVPLLVHAELCAGKQPAGGGRAYQSYLGSRPKKWENDAIELMIRLCRETGCRVHIVHLSSADAIEPLRKAKEEGLPITVETCPHYLCFSAEEIADGCTEFKCAPPIRANENRDRLWKALQEGIIDLVVSDHSPCVPRLKAKGEGDFAKAWGGISSVQFGFSAIWTEGRRHGIRLEQMAAWMARGPAALAGLSRRKGKIAPGFDADFAVVDPDATFKITARNIRHRHKLTPYTGRTLAGKIESTYLRGRKIYDNGKFSGPFGIARPGLG